MPKRLQSKYAVVQALLSCKFTDMTLKTDTLCYVLRYTYSYPTNWKQEVVGKASNITFDRHSVNEFLLDVLKCISRMQQEKGMVGIDSRVRNPRVKRMALLPFHLRYLSLMLKAIVLCIYCLECSDL